MDAIDRHNAGLITTRQFVDEYAAQARAERKALDDAVARLTPTQQARWWRIFEQNEAFDGEWAIALSVLHREFKKR